jgi:hypothetical protein
MMRDYFLWSGVGTIVIMVCAGCFWSEGLILVANSVDPAHQVWHLPQSEVRGVAAKLVIALSIVGPTLATLRIVSKDRRSGEIRILFSRPISVPAYYGLSLAMNGLGFMLVSAILWIVFVVCFSRPESSNYLPMMLLSYIFFGGLQFLLSVMWRYDFLAFTATYIAGAMAWDVVTSSGTQGWLGRAHVFVSFLPPVKRHAEIVAGIVGSGPPPAWQDLLWVGGYGTCCIGLALVLLTKMQLAGRP